MNFSIKTILKYSSLILVFGLLYYIIRKIGLREIYQHLRQANILFLILAFLTVTLYFIMWNLRWQLIINEIKKVNFFKIFPIFISGVLINTITPGARVGGEPIRAFYLSKQYKMSRSKAFATTILDKIYNFIVFALLTIFSILFVILYIPISSALKIVLIILLAIMVILLGSGALFHKKINIKMFHLSYIIPKIYKLFLFKSLKKKFENPDSFELFVNKKLKKFLRCIKLSLKTKKNILKNLFVNLVFWFFKFLAVYFIFLALGYKIEFIPIIIVITISTLLGDISFTPGGMGIIETLMITLYLAFSINPAAAAIVTVVDRAMYYFYALGVGTASFLYLNLKLKW